MDCYAGWRPFGQFLADGEHLLPPVHRRDDDIEYQVGADVSDDGQTAEKAGAANNTREINVP
jgi:hypothetical protein